MSDPTVLPTADTLPDGHDMADSYTFGLVADIGGTPTWVGTHTVYCHTEYGIDHWDGGLAILDYAPSGLADRGFGYETGHFADSVDDNGDGTHTVIYTDYDDPDEATVELVVPAAVDGIIHVTLEQRRVL